MTLALQCTLLSPNEEQAYTTIQLHKLNTKQHLIACFIAFGIAFRGHFSSGIEMQIQTFSYNVAA